MAPLLQYTRAVKKTITMRTIETCSIRGSVGRNVQVMTGFFINLINVDDQNHFNAEHLPKCKITVPEANKIRRV